MKCDRTDIVRIKDAMGKFMLFSQRIRNTGPDQLMACAQHRVGVRW
jgi:hypothetical protein